MHREVTGDISGSFQRDGLVFVVEPTVGPRIMHDHRVIISDIHYVRCMFPVCVAGG